MRLHVLSDLHLEYGPFKPLPVLGEALVLAGDITSMPRLHLLEALASNYAAAGRPVLYVPGNHEFYGQEMTATLRELHSKLPQMGVSLLHNRAVQLGGLRFFGATLWTDFQAGIGQSTAMGLRVARGLMADHKRIELRKGGFTERFNPEDALEVHHKSVRLLTAQLKKPFSGKSVVITHHAPHPGSIVPKWKGSLGNVSFVSDLTAVFQRLRPAVWIHGHMHDSLDYQVAETRVLANPRGYPLTRDTLPGERPRFENPRFNPRLVIEV